MAAGRVLITGTEGFIGGALLRHLGPLAQAAKLELTDETSVDRAVAAAGPIDLVVHLAAMSHVPTCEREPRRAEEINVRGTERLLKALSRHHPKAHLIFASTAQVYAAPSASESEVVFDESRRLAPQNHYARTKREAELLIAGDVERRGLSATVLRLFNHSHRTQSPDFFLPHLYSALKSANPSGETVVPVGNLDVYRDIGSIQDLLAALRALISLRLEHPGSGSETFNVCSGSAKHLRKLAELLAERMQVRARFEVDPRRVRAGEATSIVGSPKRVSAATGWAPTCRSEADLISAFLQ